MSLEVQIQQGYTNWMDNYNEQIGSIFFKQPLVEPQNELICKHCGSFSGYTNSDLAKMTKGTELKCKNKKCKRVCAKHL